MSKGEMIRQYILAKKGVDIGGIEKPTTAREWELFERAYQYAMFWFITSRA